MAERVGQIEAARRCVEIALTIEIAASDSDQPSNLVWIDVLLGALGSGFDVDLHLTDLQSRPGDDAVCDFAAFSHGVGLEAAKDLGERVAIVPQSLFERIARRFDDGNIEPPTASERDTADESQRQRWWEGVNPNHGERVHAHRLAFINRERDVDARRRLGDSRSDSHAREAVSMIENDEADRVTTHFERVDAAPDTHDAKPAANHTARFRVDARRERRVVKRAVSGKVQTPNFLVAGIAE